MSFDLKRFILKCLVNDQRVSVPENGILRKKRCMNGNSLLNFEYSANKWSKQLCGVYMKIQLIINTQLMRVDGVWNGREANLSISVETK